MALLEVMNVGIAFGGLQAVAQLDMKIEKGHLYGLIGPNGAGKTTVFNMLTGVYRPTEGDIILDGKNITGKAPAKINQAGIARTFQNIRLFSQMTVLDNVKIGLHNQVKYPMWTGVFRLPGFKEKEQEMDYKAMKLLKILIWIRKRICLLPAFPTASSASWRLLVRWPPIPSCCCWMNPPPV